MRIVALTAVLLALVAVAPARAAEDDDATSAAADRMPDQKAIDALDRSIDTLLAAANTAPEQLRQVSADGMGRLLSNLARLPNRKARRDELVETLYRIRWSPPPHTGAPDYLWVELALKRLEQGRTAEAAEIAHLVDAPSEIINMRIDKRFDPVTSQDKAFFDPAAGGRRQLEIRRAYAAAHPDNLAAANTLASAFMALALYTDALAVLDQTLADADPPGGAKSRFKDRTELNWTMDYRARALHELGRHAEADIQIRAAAKRSEHRVFNVSQNLNAGVQANWAAQPKQALKYASAVGDNVSRYGMMVKSYVLVCAGHQLGDEGRVRTALGYLNDHVADGPVVARDALLCANDIEAAGALTIRLLEDPKTRVQTLRGFQIYNRPDVAAAEPEPPFLETWRGRARQMRALPAVTAAADAVGHREEFDFGG